MDLDLRGSEVKMADSLESKDAVKESGKSRSPGLVVHQERSITSTASAEATLLGFQPMTEDMEDELTLPAVEAWLCELSVIGRCPDLAAKAADYAYQFVEVDSMRTAWMWIEEKEEYWLQHMKRGHYKVLEKFGFARKDQYIPLGLSTTPVRTTEARIPMQTTAVKRDASLSQENTPEGHKTGDIQSTLVNTEVMGMGSDFIVRRPPGAPMRITVAPVRTPPGGGSTLL